MQTFYAAAIDLPDVSFAVTQDNEVITKYGLTFDVVLLLKKVFSTVLGTIAQSCEEGLCSI